MLVRIVQLTFEKDKVDTFKALFEEKKSKIRSFDGCHYLELLQGLESKENVFITHSHWESEAHLNAYRHSDLFKETWATTKALFADKPTAISLNKLVELP